MTISERDRRALVLGGVALGVIIVYFGIVEPLGALHADHEQAADAILARIKETRSLQAVESEVQLWEEKAGDLVPTKTYAEQITAVGAALITAAGENGVQLQGATPTGATPWTDEGMVRTQAGTALEQATIHIDAQADWENVFKFITAIYRIDGVLSVEQLSLSSDPKAGGKLKMRLSISVLAKTSGQGGGLWAS
ncbi:MAG: hypothetical protein AMXMBFR13_36560 [Phycisphaerae bacterium]